MIQEFKAFIMRGNVIDLAVAVVIGTAFTAVVTAFVDNVIMPIIGIIGGKPSFDEYTLTVNDSVIRWGTFVTAAVSFLIIAFAMFLIVKAFNTLQARRKAGEEEVEPEPLTISEELLTEIRDLLQSRSA